jgi:hypothetical protein
MTFGYKFYLLVVLLCYQGMTGSAHQPIYATISPSQSPNVSIWGLPVNGVNNRPNAAINDNSYAEMYTYLGDTWLQLKYTNVLNAGTTSFVRVETPGFTLSSLINDVITIDAYNNAGTSSDGNLVASPTVSVVQDQNYTYLAVTPSAQYNSIRINLASFVLQSPAYVVRVYKSFYNSSDGNDCGTGWAADIGEKSLGAANASRVQNPLQVVDNNASTYSTLNLSPNQQNLEVIQTIYFSAASYLSNVIRITASVSSLFNPGDYSIYVQAYHGLTTVGVREEITSKVNIGPNTPVDVYVNPGSFFDRVKVSIKAKNNGNVGGHVNLHQMQLVPVPPTLQVTNIVACAGTATSPVSLQVTNADSFINYRWYNNGTLIPGATSSSFTGNFAPATSTYTISVTAAKSGCSAESERTSATVKINMKPPTPIIITL